MKDTFLQRQNDMDLALLIANKQAEIDKIESDRNIRLQSRASGLTEKQKENLNKWIASIEKKNEEQDKATKKSIDRDNEYHLLAWKYTDEYFTKEEKRTEEAKEKEWEQSLKYAELRREQDQKLAEAEWKLIQDTAEKREKAEQKSIEDKQAAVDQSFSIIAESLGQIGDLYQIQKENELSAAGDNATKREEIERKFAKRQQTLAIGQAIIDGAATVVGIWRKWAPINIALAQVFSAISIASTVAQVAIIRAQKFAKGGSGILNGPVHASGGIDVGIGEAEGGEHIAITSRKMTSRYGGKMLDAVSNSINQGKFFEVWANVNREMGVSDPYTKKMYELMTKTPTVYTDTDGNTVKEYPNGQKYVIKRFWKN